MVGDKAKKFRATQRITKIKTRKNPTMSHLELFVSQSNVFSGIQEPFEKANYVFFGVPFDATSTYRVGARFGPNVIRQASLNIETHSFRTGIDVEDLKLHDLGDLHVSADLKKTIGMLKLVVEDIAATGKKTVAVGGEHTITLGVLKGLGAKAQKTALVSFDAHLDLRKEFLGLKLSHATFMHWINEELKPALIVEVGTRAVCKEEIAYAKKSGIDFFTSQQIRMEGPGQIAKRLAKKLAPYENVYLSIDMDVLDPAYAPAVQNPEPEGIETHTLIDILCALCDNRVVGFDVMEVAPNHDQGTTAIQASRVIFEILCCLEKSRKEQLRRKK